MFSNALRPLTSFYPTKMPRKMPRYTRDKNLSRILGVLVAVALVATLYFARVVLIPFTLAVLITFVLTPVAKFLERLHFGRLLSTVLVVALSFIIVGAVGWTVSMQFSEVLNQLPNYKSNIRHKAESLPWTKSTALNNASDTMNEISKDLAAPPVHPDGSASVSSRNSAAPTRLKPMPVEIVQSPTLPLESVENILGLLATFGIVVVLTFFMLIRRENLRNRLISLAGQRSLHVMTQAIDDATARVTRYLRLQLVVNICYGALIGTCLHFIGIPGGLLWGVLVGVLRFLPYIGPPLGGIIPLLLSIAIFDGWIKPLEVFGLFAVTEVLVSNFIEPMLYGASTGISAMAILLAAIFWTAIWGPVGLVLCTPLTVCVVVIGRHVPRLGFLTVLLGDEPVLAPGIRYYQRLLAMDHEEAKRVLEHYLHDKSLTDLYDSVLLPALGVAERDRHRERLDHASAKFIEENTRRIVGELFEERRKIPSAVLGENFATAAVAVPANDPDDPASAPSDRDSAAASSAKQSPSPLPPKIVAVHGHLAAVAPSPNPAPPLPKIVVLPARDKADEIVGLMLCQLLSTAGYNAECIPHGRAAEMSAKVAQAQPDIVCISALPLHALANARAAVTQLRTHLPNVDILLGIWDYRGDPDRLQARLNISGNQAVAVTLAQALTEIESQRTPIAAAQPPAPTQVPEPVPTNS
jgi:predicted PurR-regulated permease PerM